LHNKGRFRVSVTGLSGEPGGSAALRPDGLLVSDSATDSADPGHVHRFHKLQLDAGDATILVVRWRLRCGAGGPRQATADRVRLRYSYLSLFDREQTVTLPFAVTLRCVGGPPANP
jgi:hypothetical protein